MSASHRSGSSYTPADHQTKNKDPGPSQLESFIYTKDSFTDRQVQSNARNMRASTTSRSKPVATSARDKSIKKKDVDAAIDGLERTLMAKTDPHILAQGREDQQMFGWKVNWD